MDGNVGNRSRSEVFELEFALPLGDLEGLKGGGARLECGGAGDERDRHGTPRPGASSCRARLLC